MHINRDGLPGSVICFFYVKSISVKSRIVAIKKLFWITETGTYSPDLFPQRNYKVLDYKSLTLRDAGVNVFYADAGLFVNDVLILM